MVCHCNLIEHNFFKTLLLLILGIFLARKFGLYGASKNPNEDPIVYQGHIDGVVSCAYTDIIVNLFLILYNEVDFENPVAPYGYLLKKLPADFKILNTLLSKSSTAFYYDQSEPTIADYFVFYAYTLAKDYHCSLLPTDEDSQALKKLEQTMRERPALAKYFNEGRLFERFSGSPTEMQYRAKVAEKKS